jgi:hypothetical protein
MRYRQIQHPAEATPAHIVVMVAPDGTAKIQGHHASEPSSPWYSIRDALSVALTMASFKGDYRDIMI